MGAHDTGCTSNVSYPSQVNYDAKYTPHIEARSCQSNYSSSTKNKIQTIQSTCTGHSKGSTCSLTFTAGETITASKINQFIDYTNDELTRRGKSQSGITKASVGNLAYPNIIQQLNTAIESMRTISGKVTPYSGEIIRASQPTPALTTLKALMSECICYTDCGGYSVCYCYGYCNNY